MDPSFYGQASHYQSGCIAVPVVKVGGAYEATCTTIAPVLEVATYSGSGLFLPNADVMLNGAGDVVAPGSRTLQLPSSPAFKSYSATFTWPGTSSIKWYLVGGDLPTGLSLSTGGGLSGTATAPIDDTFYITAIRPGYYEMTERVHLIITPLTIAPVAALTYNLDQTVSTHLTSTGGKGSVTYSVASGSLPPGVKLSTAGAFTGAATAPGGYAFTVAAHDTDKPTAQVATTNVSLTINPMTIVSQPVPQGTVGQSYLTTTFKTAGGKNPEKWSVTSGSLPPGLTFSTAGALSGKPTLAGTYTFTIQATDSSKPANLATLALTVTVVG